MMQPESEFDLRLRQRLGFPIGICVFQKVVSDGRPDLESAFVLKD
jgi:hypothetical protein